MEHSDLLAKQISRCHAMPELTREVTLSVAGCREDGGRLDGCRSYILGRTQPQANHCEMGHLWRGVLLLLHGGDTGLPGPANSPGQSDLPRGLQPHQLKFRDSRFFEPPLTIVARTPRGSSFYRPSFVTCQACPGASTIPGPLPRIVDAPDWGLHFQACSDAWRPKEE